MIALSNEIKGLGHNVPCSLVYPLTGREIICIAL